MINPVNVNVRLTMKEKEKIINYKSARIFTRIFLPDNAPRAIIQIIHGLAEHSGRYKDFAEYMTKHGIAVYVHDHPGHGFTEENMINHGHLPWNDGWRHLLDTINHINAQITNDYPAKPVFILGHSMGSLLTRHYIQLFPTVFAGVILSGTSNPGVFNLATNLWVIKSLAFFGKSSLKLKWLNQKFYNDFNKTIKQPLTGFDWLSRDQTQVNRYIADPMCGFDLSLGFFKNLLSGTISLKRAEKKLNFPKDLAVLIISGKADPVGSHAIDPSQLYNQYRTRGCINVDLVLCEGQIGRAHV